MIKDSTLDIIFGIIWSLIQTDDFDVIEDLINNLDYESTDDQIIFAYIQASLIARHKINITNFINDFSYYLSQHKSDVFEENREWLVMCQKCDNLDFLSSEAKKEFYNVIGLPNL